MFASEQSFKPDPVIALFTLHLGQLRLTVIVCIQQNCKIFFFKNFRDRLPMTLPSPPNVFPTKPITAFQAFPNIFRQNKLRPFTFRLLSSPSDKQLEGIIVQTMEDKKSSFDVLSKVPYMPHQVFNSKSLS